MQRAALFVHPSPKESFGVVAVEALATGLPVVTADSGGVTEIVGDASDGLGIVVPADDAEAFADAVLTALDPRERIDPRHLRATVEARFALPIVAARLADLYEEVLRRRADVDDAREPRLPGTTRRAISLPSISLRRSPPADPARIPGSRPDLVVVVAADPRRARGVLHLLPTELLSRLVVVTTKASYAVRVPGLARVVAVDPVAEYRRAATAGTTGERGGVGARIVRLLRNPRGVVRRRRIRRRRAEIEAQAVVRVAARTARKLAAESGAWPLVVCLDAADVALARTLLGDRSVALAPSGIAWLADATPDAG